jgi:4-amino-4-deoxy-L-arabinose transferase-like glycosyltransferase
MYLERFFIKQQLFNLILCLVFGLCLFVRFYKLEQYPKQINQDELSNIYDGYSIAQTGADRWGQKHPIILRAYGEFDYRPPLNAWLCAASIKLLGYSIFSGRLPSAIIGCLSLLLLFFVSKKLAGNLFALFALIFAGLSPWHILFSRMAHEGTILPPFFMILAIYFWIKLKERRYNFIYLILLGFTTGIATNAYQSTKLIFFILSIIFALDIIKNSKAKFKNLLLLGLSTFIGALPQILAATTIPEHFFTRATNGTINKGSITIEFIGYFFQKFFANLSPKYLFFSFGEFNNLSIGRLLTAETAFFYFGIIVMLFVIKKTNAFNPKYLYLFIFIGILPSALTPDNPHAIRTSACLVLFPFFSASGVLFFYQKINNQSLKQLYTSGLVLIIVCNALFFIWKYTKSDVLPAMGQQNNAVLVSEKINEHQDKYSKVFIEDFGNMIYIYIASYCHISPIRFQQTTKKYTDNGFGGDHFTQLDKYYFLRKSEIDSALINQKESSLLVLRSKNQKLNLIDSLNSEGITTYFYRR